MSLFTRIRPRATAVAFCDRCSSVCTAVGRAAAHRERAVVSVLRQGYRL